MPNLLQVQGTSNTIAHGSYHHLESNVEATQLAVYAAPSHYNCEATATSMKYQ